MEMHPHRLIIILTHIHMNDVGTQLTLQTWMSAAFPTGAFTCSHGLETAIDDGRVHDALTCEDWIAGIVQYGSGWNDALLCSAAFAKVQAMDRADPASSDTPALKSLLKELNELNALAVALCAGAERLQETTQLGVAFSHAAATGSSQARTAHTMIDGAIALPVAMGVTAAIEGIALDQLLASALQSMSSNLVWICTRLVPLGQTRALTIISRLQPLIMTTAARALDSTLDDLGSCTLLADLASIEHEQLHSRICIT